MPGRLIAYAAAAAFIAAIIYGLSHDIRAWLNSRHGRKLLEEMAAKENHADALAHIQSVAAELRAELEHDAALSRQWEQILNLPEIEPERKLAWS